MGGIGDGAWFILSRAIVVIAMLAIVLIGAVVLSCCAKESAPAVTGIQEK
jgi:acyl-coenzyme A synthetase/AMP-(fatty) acid ligase